MWLALSAGEGVAHGVQQVDHAPAAPQHQKLLQHKIFIKKHKVHFSDLKCELLG